MKVAQIDEGWTVAQLNSSGGINDIHEVPDGSHVVERFPAQVFDVLYQHGLVKDPWIPGRAEEYGWIPRSDWVYRAEFEYEPEGEREYLHFKGLDTIADVYLNGEKIGSSIDMYLPLRLDVTGKLLKRNSLAIHFHSIYQYMEDYPVPPEWEGRVAKVDLVRKMNQDFSGFLGPKPCFPRVGVFDDIQLEIVDNVEITDSLIRTTLDREYRNGIINATISGWTSANELEVAIRVSTADGKDLVVERKAAAIKQDGRWECAFRDVVVEAPALWWPKGYGQQILHGVSAGVYVDGEEADSVTKNVGFRRVEMPSSMKFTVNGEHVKLWGSIMHPIDSVSACWNHDRVMKLIELIDDWNMNILRIWGENEPYKEEFYEEMDRRGIMVWQDFSTANQLPNKGTLRDLFIKEAEHLFKRLLHHPSVFLWCGGNEHFLWHNMRSQPKAESTKNERGEQFTNVHGTRDEFIGFDILTKEFKAICKAYDPDSFYIPSTPFGGRFPNDPREGSTHGYTNIYYVPGYEHNVFAGEDTRICSPSLKSIKRFFNPEDIWPEDYTSAYTYGHKWPWPESWMKYTGSMSWKKNGPIEELYDATDVESHIYRLGMGPSLYYRRTIERNRRGKRLSERDLGPVERVCNGYIMVKPNDSWPQVYSGKIDYFLEPCIPYYAVKRAFSPVLISIEIGNDIFVWVVNDTVDDIRGVLSVMLFDTEQNKIVKVSERLVDVGAGESKAIVRMDEFRQFSLDYVIFAELRDNMGQFLARTNDSADIERRLTFPNAKLSLSFVGDELRVEADSFARCVCLTGDDDGDEFGWYFDDNYFDLLPFETKTVRIKGAHDSGTVTAKSFFSTEVTTIAYNKGS